MVYEDRIVAYFDILGFSAAIKKTSSEDGEEITTQSSRICDLLDCIDKNKSRNHEDTRVMHHFSDTIVISYLITQTSSVFMILLEILQFCMEILSYKFLLRGSVVSGKIHHDQNKVFGPALIRAHKNEQKLAIYPRIIVDEGVIKLSRKYHGSQNSPKMEESYVKGLLQKDFDGFYFIDYFKAVETEFDNGIDGMPIYIEYLRDTIETLKEKDEPDLQSKYFWLREKYNSMIDYYHHEFSQKPMRNDKELAKSFLALHKLKQ
jgi:hypothetical protein